ncbi:MAG: Smr/MutS family protein [Caulobacteraceae bacterium]
MKRPLRPEEISLWSVVTATVRPTAGRTRVIAQPTPTPVEAAAQTAEPEGKPERKKVDLSNLVIGSASQNSRSRPTPQAEPQGIEPGRRRRIARGREEIAARLDLHGLDQDRARSFLIDFLLQAQAGGARSVLVITGKGLGGQGVLRRRAPEWLSDPALRTVVAGLSPAEIRHGGEGAFYVALKRKVR